MNETIIGADGQIALLSQAERLHQQGNYQASIELCTEALTDSGHSNQDRIDWLSLRAACYEGLSSFDKQAADLSAINQLVGEALVEREAELALIKRVQEGLSEKLELQAIYDLVGEEIRQIFDAQVVTVYGFNLDTHIQELYYVYEKGERYYPAPVDYSGRPIVDTIKNQAHSHRAVIINEGVAEYMAAQGLSTVENTEPPKSVIVVPVTEIDNKSVAITLQDVDRENAFTEADARLLETLAQSMSQALENAALFDETQRRNAELEIINRIQEGLAAQLDLQSIYDLVGDTLVDIFEAQMVAIAGVDLEKNQTVMHYLIEKGVRFYIDPKPIGGLTKRMVERQEPFIVSTEAEFEALNAETVAGTEESKSGLFVPLIVGDEIRGGITIQNVDREHAFSEVDLRLLTTIANSMSVALENARLFDETQQRNAELAIINRVQDGLVAQMDLQSIYDVVGDTIQEIIDAQTVGIAGFDLEENILQIHYLCEKGERHYPKPGELSQISRRLISTKQGWKIDTIAQYDEMGIATIEGTEPSRSGIYVPLIVSDEVIGAVAIENVDYEYAFDDSDLRLMTTISSSMSIALENARLFEQATRRAQETTALAEVSRDISATLDLETVMKRIATMARDLLGAETSAIYLLDELGTGYRAISALGPIAEQIKADLIIPGEGILGNLIQNKNAEFINNSANDPRAQHIPGTPKDVFQERIMAAPLLVGELVSGMIAVWRQGGSPFVDIELDFLTGLAQQAVVAIGNARLFTEVERQKEYFQAIFDSSPVAISSMDPDGKIVSWSPAAERLFGYSADEAHGRDVDALLASHPDLYEEAISYTNQLQMSGQFQAKTVRTRKDGRLVEVEVHARTVIVGGQPVGYIGIYHDISALERARHAAERANQAKSTFLANMSHELRTPLNAIIGFTRIVRRKSKDLLPEKQIDNLDKVLVSADHLLGLINTILDIAKIEAGRMDVQAANFNIQPLIDTAVTTVYPLVKTPAVDIQTDLPSDLPKIYSDQEKLKQILINLLSNAAKFTHQGEIRVKARTHADRLEITISDTGIGIHADALSKVFDEFQQIDNSTTRAYGGTGLGLSISRRFARLLGGDIDVSSQEGRGSQFVLVLPLTYGDTISPTMPVNPMGDFERIPGKKIILVIDDNLDTQDLLRENLLDAGYQVIAASNGEEGLQIARQIKPYAITLDIMMPRKDGWQVLHELKTDPATQDIPVILLSIVDQKDMGYRLGAFDYLVKPVEEGALVAALDRLTDRPVSGAALDLLVVDDDPNIANLVAQFLDQEKYHVRAAEDGLSGLHALHEQTPDAILLDLMMPRLNGFEFISQLRQDLRYKALPIIVLTARSLTETDLERLTDSVSKVLYKDGVEKEKLLQELFEVLENLAEVEG